MKKRICDIPRMDRPREKLRKKGAEALSDKELMAILIGSGSGAYDVMSISEYILKALDTSGEDSLESIKGVGPAKATLIKAALEFARRRIHPKGLKISYSEDVFSIIKHYADRKQEHFICISVNGASEVIKSRVVSVGLVDKAEVHPREVFADPIQDRASGVIVAHNHPIGDFLPSEADFHITGKLKAAGRTLGIELLDHIVFNNDGYYSFLETGELHLI